MARLGKLLADRKITLELDDAARTWLANRGYDPAYGARPLKRVIQRNVQDPLAERSSPAPSRTATPCAHRARRHPRHQRRSRADGSGVSSPTPERAFPLPAHCDRLGRPAAETKGPRMQDLPERTATYADLAAVPSHLVAEIIAGRLVTHPRPAPRHALSNSVLGRLLGQAFDRKGASGPGGWWLLDEPELHLGHDILVPDIAGWRVERMPQLPDAAWFGLVPDWACEVLSPSTTRHDRGEKRDIYAEHGVRHLWHVDPDARILEVFALETGRWTLLRTYRDDDQVAAAPFDAVPFALGLLWADSSSRPSTDRRSD